jgi:hypothetical protein
MLTDVLKKYGTSFFKVNENPNKSQRKEGRNHFFETSVEFQWTKRRYVPEYVTDRNPRCKNLKPHFTSPIAGPMFKRCKTKMK